MTVLVTGGAGYVGSHAAARLLRDGRPVLILDNLRRGHLGAVERLRAMPGGNRLVFEPCDVGDRERVRLLLRRHEVRTVLHFAGLTYVGESVERPTMYYAANAAAGANLLDACAEEGVERFVLSSTAAVYGEPPADQVPIRETCPTAPINPYGRTKLHLEQMLSDVREAGKASGKPFAYAALRYFNVAGCGREGSLGEDHRPETHLVPVVIQAALGERPDVTVFGSDYPTPDGTCVRDYVHVEDLVDAHVTVMDAMKPGEARTYNLGIGRGYSVREIIDTVRRVSGREFEVRAGPRRAGDPPALYADPSLIRRELGWSASITSIDDIVESAWRWFVRHPKGYPA